MTVQLTSHDSGYILLRKFLLTLAKAYLTNVSFDLGLGLTNECSSCRNVAIRIPFEIARSVKAQICILKFLLQLLVYVTRFSSAATYLFTIQCKIFAAYYH